MEGKKIFISYSSKDSKLANEIVKYLEDNNFICWIAPRDISSGMDYTDLIDVAIRDCAAMLLIVSTASLKSQWVKKEVTTAVSFNKNILPFLITQTEIKGGLQFLLNNVQWIDATKNPQKKFHEIIDGLNNESATHHYDRIPKFQNNGLSGKMWIIITLLILLFGGVASVVALLHTQLENNQPQYQDSIGATDSLNTKTEEPIVAPKITKPEEKGEQNKGKNNNTNQKETDNKIDTVTVVTPPSHQTSPSTKNEHPSDYDIKLRVARNLLNRHKFQDALKEFESLNNEYPEKATEIEYYIKLCKENIVQ